MFGVWDVVCGVLCGVCAFRYGESPQNYSRIENH
jgi:hypothetical protein